MVDLTRNLCFRCAPLSLLVVESFTLLYISGFNKGVFINGQFSGISVFFNFSFCESPSLAFPQILPKASAILVSIGGPKSSWIDARRSLYELSWSHSTSTSESTLEYLLSGKITIYNFLTSFQAPSPSVVAEIKNASWSRDLISVIFWPGVIWNGIKSLNFSIFIVNNFFHVLNFF